MILDRLMDLAQSLDDQRETFAHPTWGYLALALAVLEMPGDTQEELKGELEETQDTFLGSQLNGLISRIVLKLGEMLAPPAPLLVQIEEVQTVEDEKPKRRRKQAK